jgi:hypothetical protein
MFLTIDGLLVIAAVVGLTLGALVAYSLFNRRASR